MRERVSFVVVFFVLFFGVFFEIIPAKVTGQELEGRIDRII